MAPNGILGAVLSLLMAVKTEAMVMGNPFTFPNMIPSYPMRPSMGPAMGPAMGPSMGPQSQMGAQQGPMPTGACACQGGVCAKRTEGTIFCLCFEGYSLDKTGKICLRNPPCPSKPCTNGKCYLSYYGRVPECVCDQGFKVSATDSTICESASSSSGSSSTTSTRQCTARRCRNGNCQTVSGVSKCVCNPGYTLNSSDRCTSTAASTSQAASPPAQAGPTPGARAGPGAGGGPPGPTGTPTNNGMNRGALSSVLDLDPADAALLSSSRTPQQAYMRYMLLTEM